MWTKTAKERLNEIGSTKEQIDKLSDKTNLGVDYVTQVLLEAIKQGIITKNNLEITK